MPIAYRRPYPHDPLLNAVDIHSRLFSSFPLLLKLCNNATRIPSYAGAVPFQYFDSTNGILVTVALRFRPLTTTSTSVPDLWNPFLM